MPPALYYRQSTATDIGAMAKRAGAKHLMLTHLIPPIGAERQGPWKIPGGALTDADYRKVVQDSAFAEKLSWGPISRASAFREVNQVRSSR
jgi:ribonuclease Z